MPLNPSASAFVFNPSASAFSPGGGGFTPAAAPAPAPIPIVTSSHGRAFSVPIPAAAQAAQAKAAAAKAAAQASVPAPKATVVAANAAVTAKAVAVPVRSANAVPAKAVTANASIAVPAKAAAVPNVAVAVPAKVVPADRTPSQWDDEDLPEKPAPKAVKQAAQEPKRAVAEQDVLKEQPATTTTTTTSSTSTAPTLAKRDLTFHDPREHLNIVFIGHVDAGKSTISGQIMLLTGQVDERTIAKYEKEAKEKNRDSWYLAFIMDTNEEERAKGKTVEVGRAHFTTAKKRFTLLDAPGHKNYVPNMIGGTCQADVGVLVISARKGEFETGFDRGGQTREHAMLAKTLGIQRLIIMVNKMDESTVKWSQERFENIQKKLNPFLKKWGYKPKKEVVYIPVSGYTGANIKDRVSKSVCPWYEGESFMEYLDSMPPLDRADLKPLRMPITAKYKEMGNVCVIGKVEAGVIAVGDLLTMMPNKINVEVTGLVIEDEQVQAAKAGENIMVQIKGIEEEDVHEGFVLSHTTHVTPRTKHFAAELIVTDLLEHKPLITAGYDAVLHIHAMVIECQIKSIISSVEQKTGKETRHPRFIKEGCVAVVSITVEQSIAAEEFDNNNQLGRFTLRDEGKSIAVGKLLKLKPLEG